MPQLRFFQLFAAKVKSKDYAPVLALKILEHLSLQAIKEVKDLYDEFIKLPELKYGLLVEKPDIFQI